MHSLRQRAPIFLAALWWGSLTVLGAVVVPTLFAQLPTPAMAGNLAARLFSSQTWIGALCGLVLLLLARGNELRPAPPWARRSTVWIVGGMLLALLLEFAVAPHIVARDNLRLWHSLGSACYGLQWLCALLTLWQLSATGALRSENAS